MKLRLAIIYLLFLVLPLVGSLFHFFWGGLELSIWSYIGLAFSLFISICISLKLENAVKIFCTLLLCVIIFQEIIGLLNELNQDSGLYFNILSAILSKLLIGLIIYFLLLKPIFKNKSRIKGVGDT